MATIQIRDLPDEAYETIRRRARAAGQSIQAYMRDQVLELTARPTKEETWLAIESALVTDRQIDAADSSLEQIVADIREDRG